MRGRLHRAGFLFLQIVTWGYFFCAMCVTDSSRQRKTTTPFTHSLRKSWMDTLAFVYIRWEVTLITEEPSPLVSETLCTAPSFVKEPELVLPALWSTLLLCFCVKEAKKYFFWKFGDSMARSTPAHCLPPLLGFKRRSGNVLWIKTNWALRTALPRLPTLHMSTNLKTINQCAFERRMGTKTNLWGKEKAWKGRHWDRIYLHRRFLFDISIQSFYTSTTPPMQTSQSLFTVMLCTWLVPCSRSLTPQPNPTPDLMSNTRLDVSLLQQSQHPPEKLHILPWLDLNPFRSYFI